MPTADKTLTNKSKSVLLTLMLLMSTTVVLADPGTGLCDGADGGPDNCPLDTWVWALAVILAIFAVAHLIKRKQRQISD
jgi:hypothetical protein